jgi:CO/xanthine dehydrogenase Mo-binding subunit
VRSVVNDQPFLVDQQINHKEEPIVLLAHPDPVMAEKGRRAVIVDVEPLPAVFAIEDSFKQDLIVGGQKNFHKEIHILKGEPAKGFAQAAHIFEEDFETCAQEQAYIECNGMVAEVDRSGEIPQVTVWGSLQCPYYVHGALTYLFDLPNDCVRIVQMDIGGAFGGKEDFPSPLVGHAAMLAWKSGKPVKLIYEREEDMAATTKRHPSKTHVKAGFDSESRLLALDVLYRLDGGAYATMTPVVLSRGAVHAAGVYSCPNVAINAYGCATNTPSPGAFRGFGAPQSLWAIERLMEIAAFRLGMDPAGLRRKNVLHFGDTTCTCQVIKESGGSGRPHGPHPGGHPIP